MFPPSWRERYTLANVAVNSMTTPPHFPEFIIYKHIPAKYVILEYNSYPFSNCPPPRYFSCPVSIFDRASATSKRDGVKLRHTLQELAKAGTQHLVNDKAYQNEKFIKIGDFYSRQVSLRGSPYHFRSQPSYQATGTIFSF